MGLLDRFRGPKLASPSISRAQWEVTNWRSIRTAPLNLVAGEQHYTEGIRAMVKTKLGMKRWSPPRGGFFIPVIVEFWREADNDYDPNAWVAVVNDEQVGYLRRDEAAVSAILCDPDGIKSFSYAGVVRGKDTPLGVHVWPSRNLTIAPMLRGAGSPPVTWPPSLIEGRSSKELDAISCPTCGKWAPKGSQAEQHVTCDRCGESWTIQLQG